jgi:MFS family permease
MHKLASEEDPRAAREDSCVDRSPWLRYAVMWLVGLDLRITVLAVPPVLPLVHRDLHLSETQVAALSGLPVILLAAGALPGSLLIARAGARRAAIAGILLTGAASALRGVGPSTSTLFGMTLLMGLVSRSPNRQLHRSSFDGFLSASGPRRRCTRTAFWSVSSSACP